MKKKEEAIQEKVGVEVPVKKTKKKGAWGRIMDWYAKPNIQGAVGIVYSLGAAVVIVGALFKIMHWPGAGTMLTCGMATEALLFTIGIFEKPHITYHWENLFPCVNSDEPKPMDYDGKLGGNGSCNASIPGIENLSDADAKSLTDSIKKISDTASQFAKISEVADITKSYTDNLSNAAKAAEKFAANSKSLDEASNTLLASYGDIAEKMTSAKENATSFAEKTVELNKNMGSINTAYELHLKGIQNQTTLIDKQNATVNLMTDSISKIQESVKGSAQNLDTYKQMTAQLSKNISDLNNVYGNMLNAIKA